MRKLIAIAILLVPATASAQARSSCSIRVDAPDFGVYNTLDPRPNTAIGAADIRCFPPVRAVNPTIRLSSGVSGQQIERVMTNGDHELRYNLYADPAHLRVLGDGTDGTVRPVSRTRSLGRANFRIYGYVPPRQKVAAGIYIDVIQITVEF